MLPSKTAMRRINFPQSRLSSVGRNATCYGFSLVQARGYAPTRFEYSGFPTPPEAMFDVIESPEARAQFESGEGGPLATTPAMANGVFGPPIGMWRTGSMMGYLGIVRAQNFYNFYT